MRRIIHIILIAFVIQGCNAQTGSNAGTGVLGQGTDTAEITSGNIVQKVVDSVNHYPKEPVYYIHIHNSNCYYEILVNDFPVQSLFRVAILASPIYINMGILKSGKQKLTYRIYPIDDTFPESTGMEIILGVQDRRIGLDSDTTLFKHHSEYRTIMVGNSNPREIFIAAGEKYYEHTFEFNATVPYENKGWLDGQDLRKFNQDSLYQAVLRYYKGYKKIYDNKDADELAKREFRSILEMAQSQYKKETEIQKVWDEYVYILNVEKEDIPMDNIKMSFYGDGRLVALEQANTEDLRFRGMSAFFFKYKKGKRTVGRSIALYLYLPKGKKDLTELEIGG